MSGDYVEAKSGPLAAPARWRRRQGRTDRLVCDVHRGERLVADGRGGAR